MCLIKLQSVAIYGSLGAGGGYEDPLLNAVVNYFVSYFLSSDVAESDLSNALM